MQLGSVFLAMLGLILLMGGNVLGIIFLIPALLVMFDDQKSDLASGEEDVILGHKKKALSSS